MVNSDAGQGTLELAASVLSIHGGGVAKETQAVGIEIYRPPVFFEAGADNAEVAPGRVGIETSGHDAPGMIVGGENEGLFERTRPPRSVIFSFER